MASAFVGQRSWGQLHGEVERLADLGVGQVQ
jgi:hypothetical protein